MREEREGGGGLVRAHDLDALERGPARELRAHVRRRIRHVERVVVACRPGVEHHVYRRHGVRRGEGHVRDRARRKRDGVRDRDLRLALGRGERHARAADLEVVVCDRRPENPPGDSVVEPGARAERTRLEAARWNVVGRNHAAVDKAAGGKVDRRALAACIAVLAEYVKRTDRRLRARGASIIGRRGVRDMVVDDKVSTGGVERNRDPRRLRAQRGRLEVAAAVRAGAGPVAGAVDVGVEGEVRAARRDAEHALLQLHHLVELEVQRSEGGRAGVDLRVDVLRSRLADRLDRRVEGIGVLHEERAADRVAVANELRDDGGGRLVRADDLHALEHRPVRDRRSHIQRRIRQVERMAVPRRSRLERHVQDRGRSRL